MSTQQVAGLICTVLGLGYGALSVRQLLTGRTISGRPSNSTPEKVKQGGWVGIGISLFLLMLAISWVVGGTAGKILVYAGYAVFVVSCLWGLRGKNFKPR